MEPPSYISPNGRLFAEFDQRKDRQPQKNAGIKMYKHFGAIRALLGQATKATVNENVVYINKKDADAFFRARKPLSLEESVSEDVKQMRTVEAALAKSMLTHRCKKIQKQVDKSYNHDLLKTLFLGTDIDNIISPQELPQGNDDLKYLIKSRYLDQIEAANTALESIQRSLNIIYSLPDPPNPNGDVTPILTDILNNNLPKGRSRERYQELTTMCDQIRILSNAMAAIPENRQHLDAVKQLLTAARPGCIQEALAKVSGKQ